MKRLIKEITILVTVGLLLQAAFTQVIYPFMELPSNGPVPFRTLVLVGIITLFLQRSGESWKEYGLKMPFKWWLLTLIVLLLLATNLFVVQALKEWLREVIQLPPNDYSFFAHLHGNEWALMVWIFIAWTAAAFGEEMIFRGYLMGRIARLCENAWYSWPLAILVQALLFGLGHSYAGWGAATMAMFGALVTGCYVLLTGKSIWPLIIVHGLWDSLAIILFYLNGEPST